MTYTVYHGAVINPVSLTCFQTLPKCLLAVNGHGNIDWIEPSVANSQVHAVLQQKNSLGVKVVTLEDGQFLMPGFIDTHTHAPQVPIAGTGSQYQLIDWLETLVFPLEAKFSDPEFALDTYKSVVRRIIDGGTTTCCYYGTLHLEATKKLAHIVHTYGQRAFIGKCNMDRNPDHPDHYYLEKSADASIRDTHSLITYIRAFNNGPCGIPLVRPILTPRFAMACTPELLAGLGKIAADDSSLHIQTHISENKLEIEKTKALFKSKTYAGVYDSFGLLRHNTILGHAVHLEEEEIHLIAQKKVGISHCPTSNFNLNSGIAPVGKYLDSGIKVGLGTDVSGGYSLSMLNCIQNASIASKVLAMLHNGALECSRRTNDSVKPDGFANQRLSTASLLYLATLGGAEVCALDQQIGSLDIEKSFDALLIDVRDAGNSMLWERGLSDRDFDKDPKKALETKLERFLLCGDDRNIVAVFVQGKCIGGRRHRMQ